MVDSSLSLRSSQYLCDYRNMLCRANNLSQDTVACIQSALLSFTATQIMSTICNHCNMPAEPITSHSARWRACSPALLSFAVTKIRSTIRVIAATCLAELITSHSARWRACSPALTTGSV
eukprot:scaffold73527_cov23-Tisochrysis_lutea.AAC.2